MLDTVSQSNRFARAFIRDKGRRGLGTVEAGAVVTKSPEGSTEAAQRRPSHKRRGVSWWKGEQMDPPPEPLERNAAVLTPRS